MARLLIFFHQHYKQLFVERKLYLTHFKSIEIKFKKISYTENGLQRFAANNTNQQEFLQQSRTKQYSINVSRIKIKSGEIEQGIASFGTIYQNIFDWLQRKRQESSRHTVNANRIEDCNCVMMFLSQ